MKNFTEIQFKILNIIQEHGPSLVTIHRVVRRDLLFPLISNLYQNPALFYEDLFSTVDKLYYITRWLNKTLHQAEQIVLKSKESDLFDELVSLINDEKN